MTPSPDLNKPLLKEIQDAHSALSPAAQEVIKRAMPGVAPMLPGGAEAPNVAPTLKPIGAPPPQAPSLVQKEIQDAHSALSPAAQEVIKRAMPGVAPMLPGGAEAPNVAPSLKPIGAPPPQAPSLVQKPQPTPTQTELARITAPPKLDANGAVIHNKTNTGLPGVGQIESPFKRTLATIGDVIGSSLFPGIARNIPGTSAHHNLLVNEREQEANEESKRGLESTQATEAQARADEAEANAHAKANPADKMLTVKADEGVFDANTGKWTVEPKAKTADTIEISAEKGKALGLVPTADGRYLLPKEGIGPFLTATAKPEKTPTNAFELWQKQNPEGTAQDWLKIETANKPEAKNEYEDFKAGYLKQHPNASTTDLVKAYAIAHQAPEHPPQALIIDPTGTAQVVRPGSHVAAGSQTPAGLSQDTERDKKEKEVADKARADAQKEYDLAKQLVSHPSPTNDVALIMRYIGATKPDSLGKLRLNQNEIALVTGTRSSFGDLEALVEKVSNGQKLTPKQRQDMLDSMKLLTGASDQGGAGGGAPIVQHSPSSGKYRYSTDGGKTWNEGQPPK